VISYAATLFTTTLYGGLILGFLFAVYLFATVGAEVREGSVTDADRATGLTLEPSRRRGSDSPPWGSPSPTPRRRPTRTKVAAKV
jgi:hypothetical protein